MQKCFYKKIFAIMSTLQNLKIKFKAFDSSLLEKSVSLVVVSLKRIGATICGPIPLPNKLEKFSLQTAPNGDRKAMEQYELSHHKRLLIIFDATPEVVEELSKFDLPSGVGVEIKVLRKKNA